MIKQISLIRRPEHLSKDEFRTYWRDVHAKLVRKTLPGLRRYTGSFPLDSPELAALHPNTSGLDCDCVVELCFDDLDSLTKAMATPEWLSAERKNSSFKLLGDQVVRYVIAEEYVVPLEAD